MGNRLLEANAIGCDADGRLKTGADKGNSTRGFVGPYANTTWDITLHGGNDSVSFAGDGSTLTIQGSDGLVSPNSTLALTTRVSRNAVLNGTLAFTWDYVSIDIDGPFFDPAFYLNNQAKRSHGFNHCTMRDVL